MNDDFLAFGFLLCHMNLPRQYIHNTEYEVSFYVKLKVSDVIARGCRRELAVPAGRLLSDTVIE